MAQYESSSLRNVALIGHGGTGKTSLGEAFIYGSGKTDRLGKVDDGTSILDFEPEEQKRHISINSAVSFFDWNKHKINIVDTPGDANFVMDTRNCLRIVDSAIIVLDSVGGVEFQTEKVWDIVEELKLPRMIYVSKMDRERANYIATVESIKTKLGKKATLCFLPIGTEENFKGLIDLISLKALTFDDARGKYKKSDIPNELMDQVEEYREALVEDIAECDETLMEKYLEEGDLSEDDLKAGFRKGVISGDLIPATCGSALKNIGITPLMDMIVEYLPSPVDRGPVEGRKPSSEEIDKRSPDPSSPFSAMVFKTIADPYAGKLTLFRVFSGIANSDTVFYNPLKKVSEKFGNIFYLEGKTQRSAESLIPGDIAAVAKLKDTATGDTICNEKAQILFEQAPPVPGLMSFAIQPKSKGDEEKIATSLNRLIEEDPTLSIHRDDQTRELILTGMGQTHIEVTIEKMKRKFGVEVELHLPKVPYKETIKGKTQIQGKYKKQSGGRGQYGDTWLEIEPLPRGQGFEFADKIVGGVIPRQYIPAVEKGIVEAMAEGVIAGYPVVDVRVSLYDGSFHTVDSSEMAFKIAASMGFKKGVLLCQPTLLEPIVSIDIEISDEYMGDVIGDLNGRRGRVLGMDTKGSNQIVKGQVPLAEILNYAADLRSMTSGRGTFSFSPSHYEEVPAHIAEKIIVQAKKAEE
ncbi:MAG TPA: elongation factor G [Deltaproteobacteria bacterium]|nr:elongation factor G [Deltaproteobacteria bacterium]